MEKKQFIRLVDRYLEGSANEGEKQLIEEYLSRLEFPDDSVLNSEEEEQMKHAIWLQIQSQSLQQSSQVVELLWYRKRQFRVIAIAASLLLAISLGVLLLVKINSKDESVIVQDNEKPADSSLTFIRHEVNNSGKEKTIQLSDGSSIILAKKAEITYMEPFARKREITLTGKAYFKVAKDKTSPFTVMSGEISTTALGTEFTVTTFNKSNQVIVRLYEGKVVVKSIEREGKRMEKDVYLLPGQAFVYGGVDKIKINAFELNNVEAPSEIMTEELFVDDPSLPQNAEGSWYMFNNQLLSDVFDQLAEMYNVQIAYNKKDLDKMYFIGKYNKTDSVENILNEIAILNNLRITKTDNKFTIIKKN